MSDGIMCLDMFQGTELKLTASKAAAERTFAAFQKCVEGCVKSCDGSIWQWAGEGAIACGFPTVNDAVGAAIRIQERLLAFNRDQNELKSNVFVRIGIARGEIPPVARAARSKLPHPRIDEASKLQVFCAPGRIAISAAVFSELSFNRRNFRPSLAKDSAHPLCEGAMVWTDRAKTEEEMEHLNALEEDQKQSYPLVLETKGGYSRSAYQKSFADLPSVLATAVVILGETRADRPNGGPVSHPCSSSDAVGLLEIMAALQSSPGVRSAIDEWRDTGDLACTSNIVVVGSPAVNLYAFAANAVSSAGFDLRHAPMRIRAPGGRKFPETASHSEAGKYYGLVALTRNPFNPRFDMLWVAGICGMATQSAALFVRDLVTNPSATVDRIGTRGPKPNVAVVAPNWGPDFTPTQYQGRWRISDYDLLWSGRG